MDLRGNKLKTTDISHTIKGELCCRDPLVAHMYFRTSNTKRFLLSNLEGKDRTVIACESTNYLRCADVSNRITVPAYGTVSLPVTYRTLPYVIFTKPKRVLVRDYRLIEGSINTFNVESGITFDSTVENPNEK
jgi:hypothetical protein